MVNASFEAAPADTATAVEQSVESPPSEAFKYIVSALVCLVVVNVETPEVAAKEFPERVPPEAVVEQSDVV